MVGADTSFVTPVEMIGLDVADLILDAVTGLRYWTNATVNYTLWYREIARRRCIFSSH